VEPALDLRCRRRPSRPSGRALPDGQPGGVRHQPRPAATARGGGRPRGGPGAGDRRRRRHALQLPREQALDVRRLTRAPAPAVALLLTAVALLGLLAAAPAGAQSAAPRTTGTLGGPALLPRAPSVTDNNAVVRPSQLDRPPAGHRLSGRQAQAIASRNEKVHEALRKYPTAKPEVFLKGRTRWQVSWFTPGTGKDRVEVAQVYVDDATGAILEAWTGPQVAWTMTRGYSGAFGRKVNSPWVWIPLSLLFVAPFITPRRLRRWLHLDLLVLVAFGVSVAYFNDANLDAAVPIVFVLLLYLLARMLAIGLQRRAPGPEEERRPLPLLVPTVWLAVAVVFLIGFRIGLNVTSSNVIDVGYSGVIGADRLADGNHLYGKFPKDNEHGDTYGPFAYEAYVPFEQARPWSGRWDDLPAAHAAAIAFDLLTILLLFLTGRQIRGPGLGVVLAYAWVTWPFSLYALSCNSNDGLVAALAALSLFVASRPAARGAVTALAGFTKFGSLGLVPLMATHGARRGTWLRTIVLFTLGFAAVSALVWAPVLLRGESLRFVYDRTIGFQAGRIAPLSIWGLHDLRGPEQVWQVGSILFALAAGLIPRRRDVIGLAAMAAAVVIALQIGLSYWFYLYLVWFFPFAALALFGRFRVADPA
jgi:hypothetical protein